MCTGTAASKLLQREMIIESNERLDLGSPILKRLSRKTFTRVLRVLYYTEFEISLTL